MAKEMRSMAAAIVALLAIAAVAGCAGGRSVDNGGAAVLGGLTREVLPNGLTVVVKEDHRLPIVTSAIFYKVGAANEAKGLTGISHFLEHMMFKGTAKYGKGDIDKLTYLNGGSNNAFTTSDYTGYHFDWGSDKWAQGLEVMRSWMTDCAIDGKEMNAEREVIWKSELFKNLSSQSYLLYQEMITKLFPAHPYEHTVLGSKEDLEKLSRDQMAQYYKSYYKPNNAVIVVVGDVDPAKVVAKSKELFGDVPAGDVSPGSVQNDRLDGERRFTLPTPHQSTILEIAYRTEQVGTESDYVFDVISTILGHGKGSRLYRRVVEKEKLASDIDASNGPEKYGGAFYVYAHVAPGADVDRLVGVIDEEIERVKSEPATSAEIARAKTIIAASFLFDKESVHDMAMSIGHYEALGLPNYMETYLARIDAVGQSDILRTANSFLLKENRVVGVASPKNGNKDERGIEQRLTNEFNLDDEGQQAKLGEYHEVRLENGLTLLMLRRQGLPIVQIRAFVDAGRMVEPDEKAGIARIVGDMLDEGTEDSIRGVKRSDEEIASTVENVGGELSTSEDGVKIKMLRKESRLAFDLLHDLLVSPSFPEERLQQVKQLTLAQIAEREDDADSVGWDAFMEEVFRGHPKHKPQLGYRKTVETISREDVVAYYKTYYRPDTTIIAVVGDISPQAVLREIKSRFTDWVADGPLPGRATPAIERQKSPRLVAKNMDTEHLSVYMGHLGIKRSDPDYLVLRVADSIFGSGSGFTDRLSSTLRNERGLAYSVWGGSTIGAGTEEGIFVCFIDPPPEKKDAAVGGMIAEIEKFVNEGPTDEELRAAKEHLKKHFVFQFETLSDIADYLISVKRHHLGIDFYLQYPRLIDAITKEQVVAALKRRIDPKSMNVVIVGPVDEKGNVLKTKEREQ